jgi:hypothetical protein
MRPVEVAPVIARVANPARDCSYRQFEASAWQKILGLRT